jgi:hypothetical protein
LLSDLAETSHTQLLIGARERANLRQQLWNPAQSLHIASFCTPALRKHFQNQNDDYPHQTQTLQDFHLPYIIFTYR